jgi:hypothetical protein
MKYQSFVWPVSILCLAAFSLAADVAASKPRDDLGVIITEPQSGARVAVGQPLAAKAHLKNDSTHDIAIPIGQGTLQRALPMNASILRFPHAPTDPTGASGPGGGSGGANVVPQEVFVTLKPGEKSEAVAAEITPLLPGELHVIFTYGNAFSSYSVINARGNYDWLPMPNAWIGAIGSEIVLNIPDQPLTADARKFKDAVAFVANNDLPLDARKAKLKEISSLKHYFAARCLLDIWKSCKGPIRDLALAEIIDLFDFGTAYEAFPDMVAVLADENVPEEARLKLLAAFEKMYLSSPYPGISIGRQAYYDLSKEQVAQATTTIKALAHGRNPRLAAAAQKFQWP